MCDRKTILVNFRVTADMVDAFARLTGDCNSMHVNPEVARKSKFRRTVVHGMIPYSYLQVLQSEYPEQLVVFNRFSTRFRRPVFIGDEINLEINYESDEKDGIFEAVWRAKGSTEALIKSSGKFQLDEAPENNTAVTVANSDSFLVDSIEENQYLIADLSEQKEAFNFQISGTAKKAYFEQILDSGLTGPLNVSRMCNNLASILMLSTMVGMRLPGRYAIFARFEFEFSENILPNENYLLLAGVTKASVPIESMEAAVSIVNNNMDIGNGKLVVLLNPPPRKMLSSQEIVDKHRYLGLEDKVVLITGASRGIGETAAKLFAALDAKVIINYFRGKNDAEHIVEEIQQSGGTAICVQCDITDEDSVKKMMRTSLNEFGRIDVLVNNAVRDFSPKDIIDMEWQDYLQELDVSVKGLHACCKAVIPIFRDNGGGKIINLSTVAVDNPVAGQSRYITAKSAVTGYTKSLAKELMKFNIQANLVVPNMTDTDLVSVLPSMYKNKIAESRPYGRHVYPVEVAQSIVFLASNWSNAITGQKLVLNLGEPPFA
ncbi:MAG: SDR family oxidoreductase [Gammaproteobacteria bacterium]|nr:SDR family oxidoreductase [Gammaproteobacteria bacterium]